MSAAVSRTFQIFIMMIGCFIPPRVGSAEQEAVFERYRYLEISGGETITLEWRLEKADQTRLTVLRPDETHISINNAALETVQWSLDGPTAKTKVVARRERNSITIEGMMHETPVRTSHTIDEKPWYQAITLSLQPFSRSSEESVEFWSLRPDTLQVYKLKATKESVERIAIGEQEVDVQKIRISLAGFRSHLWYCFYWYRAEDGLFMKHAGSFGLPGLPRSTITFLEKLH